MADSPDFSLFDTPQVPIKAAAPAPAAAAPDFALFDTPQHTAPAPPADRGKLDAVVRSAGNVFGLGPILAAGTEQFGRRAANVGRMIAGKPTEETGTFEDSRKVYADAADQADAQHPYLTALGAIPRTAAEIAVAPELNVTKGLTAGGKLAVAGIGYGAAGGAGDALSHGKSAAEVVKAAEVGGAAGGATAGVLGGAARVVGKGADLAGKAHRFFNPSAEEATRSAQAWVAKDIAGEIKSASTPTARKQLADDAKTAGRLVLSDPELDDAVSAAESGNHDALRTAQGLVRDRISESGAKLAPGWGAVDAALPKPLTSGDVIRPLVADASKLRATGRTTDKAEAEALDTIVGNLKNATDWGGNSPVFNPQAIVKGGDFDGATAGVAVAKLERMAAKVPELQPELDRIRADASPPGFNPDHPISAEQVQKMWSDQAGIAYGGQGGINGTVTFEKKLDVASHLRALRDDVLNRAAAADPEAVDALRDELKTYSALKRVEKVFDQRINHAQANASGASVPTEFVKNIKEWKHSPLGKSLTVIPEAVAAKKKEIDKTVARAALNPISPAPPGIAATAAAEIAKLTAPARAAYNAIVASAGGKTGSKVVAAIRAGVPRALAMEAASAPRGARVQEGF